MEWTRKYIERIEVYFGQEDSSVQFELLDHGVNRGRMGSASRRGKKKL